MKEFLIVAVVAVLAASMVPMYAQGFMIRFSSMSNTKEVIVLSEEVGGGRQ